jgi:hypothetical protein
MKSVVVYESMYGNTHLIADAIAEGLREHGEATAVPVNQSDPSLVESADVVVVGGPTHAHGMTRAGTRKGAVQAAEKPGTDVVLDAGDDPDAYGVGLREWFASIPELVVKAAAFDTRFDLPAAFTGRASKGIARKLRSHGATFSRRHVDCLARELLRVEGQPPRAARAGSGASGAGSSASPSRRKLAGKWRRAIRPRRFDVR